MEIVTSLLEMKKISSKLCKKNKTIGFIPTMGALHEGHLKLVKESKKNNDITVVSIFVNPAQFLPREDLAKYPRPFKNDRELLEKEKVDFLFYPKKELLYPLGFQSFVTPNKLASIFEGKSRPGHFTGVATIVLKLFNLIQPTHSYFGQKDYQQCVVIEQIVTDLNLQIKIIVVPTVRDSDGLALSSRNIFLNEQERFQAISLYQSLLLAKKLFIKENRNVLSIKKEVKNFLHKFNLIHLDYFEICDPENLIPLKIISKKSVIVIAAYCGKTRLIDNLIIFSKN